MCFDCFLADEPPHSDDKYYIVYGRLTSDAVQMFLGYVSTSKGDTEFDAVAEQLGLQSFSYTADHFETAEEWAKKDARKLHPTLPIEIRFMECGAVASPGAVLLLPVNENEPHICQTCQHNGNGLKQWRSVWKWGYPFFCSQACIEKWYEELPFQAKAVVPGIHRGFSSSGGSIMNVETELPAAINSRNAKKVGQICDHLRFERQMSYNDQMELAVRLGCSPEDFEELLYEADQLGSS